MNLRPWCRRRFSGPRKAVLLLLVGVLCSTSLADAALIYHTGSSGTLNKKNSWHGKTVPTAADIAVWNANSAGSLNLGSNLSWLGIQILAFTGNNLVFNSGNTLTLGSGGIDMSVATVDFTLNCSVVLAVAQTWSVNSGRNLTAGGVLSGSGGLTKTGAGTLTLTGANTYTGGTTIHGGMISINNAASLGVGTTALVINPTGTLRTTGTFATSRATTLGGTGGASSGGTFDVTSGTTHTRDGVISGTGSLTKTGAGILSLTAANTYSGGTFVNAGTLSTWSDHSLGAAPAVLGSSTGSVQLANGTTLQTNFSTTGDNRQLQLLSGTATLEVTNGYSQQRNGLTSGSGGLVKTGIGTLILTNANTYTGGTTVNAGTLQVNNTSGSATGTGAVVVNSGGTLSGLPAAVGFTAPGSIAGSVTINTGGTLLARSGGTFTFGGLTLNAGAITNFQLGAHTSTAIINITGINALNLAGASTINIVNAGSLGAGTYQLFNYSGSLVGSFANLTLGSTPGLGYTYSLSNNQTNGSIDLIVSLSDRQWAHDLDGLWGTASNWTNNAAPNAAGAQANFFGTINSARTVTVNGAYTVGSMTFDNAHSYTVAASAGNSLTLNNSGTAHMSALQGNHSVTAPLTLANDLSVSTVANSSLTLGGAISGTGRSLTTSGAGTVALNGTTANTYSGLTTVESGTLQLAKTAGTNAVAGNLQVNSGASATLLASNQIADSAVVTVNGTFTTGAFLETIGSLAGEGNIVTAAGGVLTIGSANNLSSTFAGVISGSGTIAKAGTGTLTLTGTNTFGGAGQTVSITGGVLAWAADANLGHSSNSIILAGAQLAFTTSLTSHRSINLTGAGTFNTDTNAATLNGVISGTGSLVKTGSGSLSLGGANTYTGGTTVTAGTLVVNSATSLGNASGALTINNGALQVANTFTTARNIALGHSDSTIAVNAGHTYTTTGALSGTGSLNKSGAGTLLLNRATTFSGATVIDEGTLIAAGTNGRALANTTSVVVNTGGTLLFGAHDQVRTATGIELAGGTIAKGNFSQGSTTAAGLGALTLSDDSRIDFGTGTVGVLSFSRLNNTEALLLTIDNWTGTAGSIGNSSTDRLVFQVTSVTGFTSTDLMNFSFTGYSGAMQHSLGGGFWEITPVSAVPEPGTYAAGALALIVVARQYVARRRRRNAASQER
jgi:fibronectin-binding autotransporter adhesin